MIWMYQKINLEMPAFDNPITHLPQINYLDNVTFTWMQSVMPKTNIKGSIQKSQLSYFELPPPQKKNK